MLTNFGKQQWTQKLGHQVTIDDAAQAEKRVSVLMGDKVEPRRKWIENNVKFTMEEETVF